MTDINSQAAKTFYGLVRSFAEKTKEWEPALRYDVKPDERYDLTLVSQRVYGNRDEYLAVMAVAGIDTADEPLKQQSLVFPTSAQLFAFKRKAGFESIASFRENNKPIWQDN